MTASQQLTVTHQFGTHLSLACPPPVVCPPPDALPANGVFYMGASGPSPCDEDRKSYWEKGVRFAKRLNCQSCGLSMWADEEGVHEARERSAKVKTLHIFRIILSPVHGVYKNTPGPSGDRHHTLWRNVTEDPFCLAELFLSPLISVADLP